MKTHFSINIFFCFLTLYVLGSKGNSLQVKHKFALTKNPFVDYKRMPYDFYIGQTQDSIEKVIDLQHAYLADDFIINDNGITHYMNIGEELVNINQGDCLPALFFTTNKRVLTEFTCSILFYPNTFQMDSIYRCLTDIKPLFTLLNSIENRTILAKTLKLNIKIDGFEESFSLDTASSKYTIGFKYEKKIK